VRVPEAFDLERVLALTDATSGVSGGRLRP
jgi:hypothetical protein